MFRSVLTFTLKGAGWPQSHAAEEPVSNNQSVEQHCAKVCEKCREEEICKNGVRLVQYRRGPSGSPEEWAADARVQT